MNKILSIIAFLLLSISAGAQNLDSLLNEMTGDDDITTYAEATFKTQRIVNSQSIENSNKHELTFLISHHFGDISTGIEDLYGLDYSVIRFGFEYGLSDYITLGVGRGSYEKVYDGFVKIKLLRQSSGQRNMPVSVSLFSGLDAVSAGFPYPERDNLLSSRFSYSHQLLIARKFSERLSLQISPTLIHNNLVKTKQMPNDNYYIGMGGRFKLTKRTSVNAEYFAPITKTYKQNETELLALGFDIETGGHVFQLYFTNAVGLVERQFISEVTLKWPRNIHFGFNISRVFSFKK